MNNENARQKEFSGEGALTGEDQVVTLNASGLKGVVEIRLFLDWDGPLGGVFEVSNIALVSEFVGKTSELADLKLLKADGTEISEEEKEALGELVAMTASLLAGNKGATANAERNGKLSGTCDFGGGSFDELLDGEDAWTWTYDLSRANSIEMNGGALVGNLIGNTLTLTMDLSELGAEGFVWVFTYTITGTIEAAD